MRNTLIVCAALWFCSSEALAQDVAARVTVPAHTEWCASSQPVDIAKQTDPEFGALVFQFLYARIEQTALAEDMKSVGVPYLAATADVPPPAATPPAPSTPLAPPGTSAGAAPGPAGSSPEPSLPSMTTFTVCTVVPPGSPAPGEGITVRSIPASDFFAMRCEAKFDEDCKDQIIAAMTQAQIDVSKLTDKSWSIRQATSASNDAAALVADLSDHSLRSLQDGGALAPPAQMITVAAAVP